MKNIIYAENHFHRAGMVSEVTFNTRAGQNVNYVVYTHNIYRFNRCIKWLCYNNQGNLVIGIVKGTPLCDTGQDFTSNKIVEMAKIVV